MKWFSLPVAATFLLVTSHNAFASTFSFTFNMPAFNKDLGTYTTPIIGKSSVLRIDVDNGGSTLTDQSYLFSDIQSITLVSLESTLIDNLTLSNVHAFNPLNNGVFLRTFGSEFAELDLSGSLLAPGTTAGIMFGEEFAPDDISDIQLAAINNIPGANPFDYYVRIEKLGIITTYDAPFVVRSNLNMEEPATVPLPASLPLLTASLIGAMLIGRHRRS